MARYEHLPIFALAYRLALHIEQQVAGFSNRHRQGIGADLRRQAQRVLGLVIRANSAQERICVLTELRDTCEQINVMLRLAKDLKAFPGLAAYEAGANLASSLGRQAEGWLRGQRQRPAAGRDAEDG